MYCIRVSFQILLYICTNYLDIRYAREAANVIDYYIISYYSLNLSFMTKNYYKQLLLAIGLLAILVTPVYSVAAGSEVQVQ